MRHGTKLVLLILVLAQPVAADYWATWELELGTHTPPDAFVLSVTSPSGVEVPPPLDIAYGKCTAVPQAPYCGHVGCPPQGVFEFQVRAKYGETLSEPSNTWTCAVTTQECVCEQKTSSTTEPTRTSLFPPDEEEEPLQTTTTTTVPLTQEKPPLQTTVPPLNQVTTTEGPVQPVKTIPSNALTIPPVPSSSLSSHVSVMEPQTDTQEQTQNKQVVLETTTLPAKPKTKKR